MKSFTEERFTCYVDQVQQDNYFDFQSFVKLMTSGPENVPENVLDDLIDILVFEYGVNCDADFYRIDYQSLIEIIEVFNDLMKKYYAINN